MVEKEITVDAAEEYREEADALDALAEKLSDADSIAEDCPALSELFHAVRTSNRRARDGRHVALLEYDGDEWTCRTVSFLESGTHYRDTGADLSLSYKPYPLLSVEEFAEQVAASIRRDARAARQSASEVEQSARRQREMEEDGYL